MKRVVIGLLVFVTVLVLSLAGHWWYNRGQNEIQLVAHDCELDRAPCSIVYHGHHIQVQMERPQPLKPFWLHVRTEGVHLEQPSLQFAMQGMEMDQALLRLPLFEPGHWQYQAILPVCTTGRSDWVVWLRFRLDGQNLRLEFPFKAY